MLDILRQIAEAIQTTLNVVLDFFVGFGKWLPLMARLNASTANFWTFIPSTLLPVALISATFYALCMLLHGGSSK